jgi:hypothetical protein
MSEFNNDFIETPAVEEAVEDKTVETVEEPVVEAKPKKEAKAPAKSTEESKVALYSERNVNWSGVGSLKAGYNIVSKEDADKWLSGSLAVRLATPEEISVKASV